MAERQLPIVHNHDGLLNAMLVRISELEVTRAALNERAGLPDGYVGKIFGPRPSRALGLTKPMVGPRGARLDDDHRRG
jgi:hypothetical protein